MSTFEPKRLSAWLRSGAMCARGLKMKPCQSEPYTDAKSSKKPCRELLREPLVPRAHETPVPSSLRGPEIITKY